MQKSWDLSAKMTHILNSFLNKQPWKQGPNPERSFLLKDSELPYKIRTYTFFSPAKKLATPEEETMHFHSTFSQPEKHITYTTVEVRSPIPLTMQILEHLEETINIPQEHIFSKTSLPGFSPWMKKIE